MELSEIKTKIQTGDMKTVAKMVGISHDNARQALGREGSKYHKAVINALENLITTRESLIEKSLAE